MQRPQASIRQERQPRTSCLESDAWKREVEETLSLQKMKTGKNEPLCKHL